MSNTRLKLIRSCRNKVQASRFVRIPQLYTSPHFHNYHNDKQLISLWPPLTHKTSIASSPQGHRSGYCIGCARGGFKEAKRGEDSSWSEFTAKMISIIINFELGYKILIVDMITGTLQVLPSRSSCTRERSSQYSNGHNKYGPNC